MLESANLSVLIQWALSNSADSSQLLIFWQTVQRDSQSILVIGKSCSKALWYSILSKSHQNWSNSKFAPSYFWLLLVSVTPLVPSDCAGVKRYVLCRVVKMIKVHFLRQSVKICSELARHKFYLVYMYTYVIYLKKSNSYDSFLLTTVLIVSYILCLFVLW